MRLYGIVWLLCAPTAAQAVSDPNDSVQLALKALEAEARVWVKDTTQPAPHAAWPHPQVQQIGPDRAIDVLEIIGERIDGGRLANDYVRFHMLEVVSRALKEGSADYTSQLSKLLRGASPLQELTQYPPEVLAEIKRLMQPVPYAVKGYYPWLSWQVDFERIKDPAERAQVEKGYQRAQELISEWRKKCAEINAKLIGVNNFLFDYRYRIIELLALTGEQKGLKLAINATHEELKNEQDLAFDYLYYLYQALFDGALERYEDGAIRAVGSAVLRVCEKFEGPRVYYREEFREWWWPAGYSRDFSESAFLMRALIERRVKDAE